MHLIFYKTNDVFQAEALLKQAGLDVEIAPAPVQDKAYCGVCIKVSEEDFQTAGAVLAGLEYKSAKQGEDS